MLYPANKLAYITNNNILFYTTVIRTNIQRNENQLNIIVFGEKKDLYKLEMSLIRFHAYITEHGVLSYLPLSTHGVLNG